MSKIKGLPIKINKWSPKDCDNFRSIMFNECEKYNMFLKPKQRKFLMDNKELKNFAYDQAKCILRKKNVSSGGRRNTRSKKNRRTKKRKTQRNNIRGGLSIISLVFFTPLAVTALAGLCVIGTVGYCALSACSPTRSPTIEFDREEFRLYLEIRREREHLLEQAIRDANSINNMPE
jgi:hypothetical protein